MPNPFVPGDPRINRKGRPKKGQAFTEILDKVLREKTVVYKGQTITGKEAAARKLLELAVSGDVAALKYIADRLDGRPEQKLQADVKSEGVTIVLTPDESRLA